MKNRDQRDGRGTNGGKIGDRPRLLDIARSANVSVSTVSRALNRAPGISEELRRQVIETAAELGYDRISAGGKAEAEQAGVGSVTLVTFYQYITDASNTFYNAILEEIRRSCARRGIKLRSHLLDRSAPDIDEFSRTLNSIACDSVLTLGIDEPPYLDLVKEAGIPTVIVNGEDPEMQMDSVSPAYRAGANLATRHLIEMGHTKIVHLTALQRSTCRRRLDGFNDAMRNAGIGLDDDSVIDLDSFDTDVVEAGMLRRLRERENTATAYCCVTDSAALGLISALRKCGLDVPGDVSVIGFDDMPISEVFSPSLSTIHVAREAIGRTAVERLLARVGDHGAPAWRVELGGHLVQRESVRSIVD